MYAQIADSTAKYHSIRVIQMYTQYAPCLWHKLKALGVKRRKGKCPHIA